MQLPLKGQSVKNVSMVEQYYPKTITFMLVICSSLKKKVDPPSWATPWDQLGIRISRRIQIYIKKGFSAESVGWGKCFIEKNQMQNFS
jgi:hypothetical protein